MEGFIISILKNFRFWFNCLKFNHIRFEKWKWITIGCKGSELIEVRIRQSKSAHRDLNLHHATVNARVLRYFTFNRDACPIAKRLKGGSRAFSFLHFCEKKSKEHYVKIVRFNQTDLVRFLNCWRPEHCSVENLQQRMTYLVIHREVSVNWNLRIQVVWSIFIFTFWKASIFFLDQITAV